MNVPPNMSVFRFLRARTSMTANMPAATKAQTFPKVRPPEIPSPIIRITPPLDAAIANHVKGCGFSPIHIQAMLAASKGETVSMNNVDATEVYEIENTNPVKAIERQKPI